MGYPCEKTHHRTSPAEQNWIETITCQQHSPAPAVQGPASAANLHSTNGYRKHRKLHRKSSCQSKSTQPGQNVAGCRSKFAASTVTSFHYPFNLFHPFHSSSLQYPSIILDKLSQFITKHVAAKSGSIRNTATLHASHPAPKDQPLPLTSPECQHSHNTGCSLFAAKSAPASEPDPQPQPEQQSPLCSTVCRERSALEPGAFALSTSTTAPSSVSSLDPSNAPVAFSGSSGGTTGCTQLQSRSSTPSPSKLASSLFPQPIAPSSPFTPAASPISHLTATSISISTTTTKTGASMTTGTIGATTTTTTTSTTTTTTTTTKPSNSHYLVRHSLCLYAASSVILALCYLTIPTVASDAPHTMRQKARFAEGKSDKEILDHLLKGSRYDKRLLPPVDDADFCCGMQSPEMAKHMPDMRVPGRPQNRGSLTVNVSVLLLSLASPDESSLKYEVEFLLQQQWYDPRLRYANQSQYEYLNAIHHHEDIWLPDTYFIMHGDFKDPIIPMHFALRIYRNGTINYLMRRHLILSCQGRLNIFPFDDPLCSFALESISYEQSAIRYVWKNDEDTLRKSPSLTTLNAYLIQNQTITCPIKASWRGNYSCLKVDLMFTRDRAFYFTTVFIPGIILVTSSFITFWLEWNAVPARVMIGVTTMLNFFTTSNGFRSTLPVVSNLTAMNVWDGVCMCFIYASLLEFVCVNYVGRKRPLHNVVYRPGENPVTQGVKKRESGGPNEIVACTSCAGGTSPCTHSANNGCATETCFVQVRKKEPPHPIRVAKTIDVIARITFPSAYAVFLIFFFIHYKGFS
ncbi:glutamate-gated chloride channel isoform X18 [Wyeomyia smithii]|uniref:glutamate-gated chloride channel isoform X18 n=1 Tax=Wyeomyia smithii TaxID=174621 RepID=UPI002467BA37|nr:glutamate-gated chloride channel isoform X18 [Wyeomyia smithii]